MSTLFSALAWIGQAGFFSRFLIQWLHSERSGKPEAPVLFWWISLGASICLGSYLIYTGEPVLFAGLAINSTIYVRNLWIAHRTDSRGLSGKRLAVLGTVAVLFLFALGVQKAQGKATNSNAWLACAILGQGIWSSRFVVQWWYTERKGMSHFPPTFWWLSLAGNSLLLAYTIQTGDPKLIVGYVMGPVVQIRNLVLHARNEKMLTPQAPPEPNAETAGAAEPKHRESEPCGGAPRA